MSITGIGSLTFEKLIKSAYDVYKRFQHQFPDGKLETWEAGTYKGRYTLSMSNRYLTPKRDVPGMVHVPFSKAVDPHGILEEMAHGDYIHCEDNQVLYYTCQTDAEGQKR